MPSNLIQFKPRVVETPYILIFSSATGSIYDENTLRESFFMMRNAAPREYDYGSSEYIRRMVEDKHEL